MSKDTYYDTLLKWDQAFNDQQRGILKSLLASNAVLHADGGLTVGQDIQGAEAITHYFEKFFDNYNFRGPISLLRATSDTSVFSLWVMELVFQKPIKYEQTEQEVPASGNQSTLTGVWRLEFDANGQISDVWMLRTLTPEENRYELKERTTTIAFSAKEFAKKGAPGEQFQSIESMTKAAKTFDHSWHTGDASQLKDIMREDAHVVNPIFGETKDCRKDYEELVIGVRDYWDVLDSKNDIAVSTSSNKCFLWWCVHGKDKERGEVQDMWGINILSFAGADEGDGKVKEVVGFRQPLIGEQEGKMHRERGTYFERKLTGEE